MARFLDDQTFINACKEPNRNIKMKVAIDWFNTGDFEELEYSDDELIKLTIDRELEGDIGTSIMDKGTLVLDNSNGDFDPKSIASRFNIEISESEYEFNVIPDRAFAVLLSVNGSDYKKYYTGQISSIEPNYDNSRVSLTIDDYMKGLQNTPAPDHLFVEEPTINVIETLLEVTPIDFNPNLIDDTSNLITYNFYDEGSVYDALLKLAEVVWGRFFVIEDELRFINLQNLDPLEQPLIDTIEDNDILSGYNELLSAENLYTDISMKSKPFLRQTTTDKPLIIWTGAEKEASVVENYSVSDLSGNTLQLTYTPDNSFDPQPTNRVPIIGGSLTVTFGDTKYRVGNGIDSINSQTGLITFTNDGTYPLPDSDMEISYSYYLLTIPPNQSKTIIAEYENPSIDVQSIKEHIKFEDTVDYTDVEYRAYKENIGQIYLGSSGSETSSSVTVSSNATTVRVSGSIWHKNADYKYFWDRGTDFKSASSYVDIIVDGSVEYSDKIRGGSHGGTTTFKTDRIPIYPNSDVAVRLRFNGSGEKYHYSRMSNITLNIGETVVEPSGNEEPDILVEQIDYDNKRASELIFTNNTSNEVSMYSTYKGEEVDNIYLLGVPIKQREQPFTSREVIAEEEEDDILIPFDLSGKTMEIQNDLFVNQKRLDKTTSFLLDYYSRPRSVINMKIRARGHIDLMDKVSVSRAEADIDNDFLINVISDEFTKEGEWNQTLELRQAVSSDWTYDDTGGTSIISPTSPNTTDRERPPVVTNLSLSLTKRDVGDSGYPAMSVNFDSNRFTRYHRIYIKRVLSSDWELVNTIEENSYILDSIFAKGDYDIKIVSVGYNGLTSEFDTSPTETISYSGSQIIPNEDITLTELKRKVQKGMYLPVIEVDIADYNDEYFDSLKVFFKKQTDSNWNLDGITTQLTYEILVPELGDYEVKIIPVDKHGNTPDFSVVNSIFITVNGETDLPSQVELESVYWGADYIEFNWKPHPDEDFDEYELRKDDDFGTF